MQPYAFNVVSDHMPQQSISCLTSCKVIVALQTIVVLIFSTDHDSLTSRHSTSDSMVCRHLTTLVYAVL